MKKYLLIALLAGCVAEPEVVAVAPVEPEPVVEPRRQFTDDNIPYDLTAGADLTAIPDDWVEIFCTLPWESRAEPFTGVEQWNPCLRPDMFGDGARTQVAAENTETQKPPEALDLADPMANALTRPAPSAQPAPDQVMPDQVIAEPMPSAFDIAPDPTLFLNPDGSFSRRSQ
ncbi:hypothetical protein [Pontivivens nitratireducens]|uniref:hypothetical protein n=1 Tax=Pontivivens nitratireducens TaxID=2758038 RepID=UPI00163A5BB0|nr:hypothetical protein [Pontibrevibacter nitratireducens]